MKGEDDASVLTLRCRGRLVLVVRNDYVEMMKYMAATFKDHLFKERLHKEHLDKAHHETATAPIPPAERCHENRAPSCWRTRRP